MLFRWNLLVPRAKVLKYLSSNPEIHRDVEYVTECTSCARVTKAPLCKECRKPLLKCVLCRLPVKGLANACLNCGHGGHTTHMKVWFSVRIYALHTTIIDSEFKRGESHFGAKHFFYNWIESKYFFSPLQKNEFCASGCGCSCLKYIELFTTPTKQLTWKWKHLKWKIFSCENLKIWEENKSSWYTHRSFISSREHICSNHHHTVNCIGRFDLVWKTKRIGSFER